MNKKYEYTGAIKKVKHHTLRQIRALNHLRICPGTIGGWIENDKNLSHDGFCWVTESGMIYGGARASEDSMIYGVLNGYSVAEGKAVVGKGALVTKRSRVSEYARVLGNAKVIYSHVKGSVIVDGIPIVVDSTIFGRSKITGRAKVFGSAINGFAHIYGDAYILSAHIDGRVEVSDKGKITQTSYLNYGKITREVKGKVVFIHGLDFEITAYDGYAQVGDEIYAIEDWLKFGETQEGMRELDDMEYGILEFYPKLCEILKTLQD